ncbi:hypothetical protein, partial [Aeromonas sp. R9-1]|uniref:hypothetical protein n=1 Tax=Aeromonas sp. R9-1 TaxID=3138478 RepID=UPI0034A4F404
MASILMRLRRMGHEGFALDIFSPANSEELSQAPEPMASSLMRLRRMGHEGSAPDIFSPAHL